MSISDILGAPISKYKRMTCEQLDKRRRLLLELIKQAEDEGAYDIAKKLEKEYRLVMKLITNKRCEF